MPKKTKTQAAKKTTNKPDIYDLYQKQMEKSEPSVHGPKIQKLIDQLKDIASKKGKDKDKESPKIKKALIKLQEALDCFEVDSNKAYEGRNVEKIMNGLASYILSQPPNDKLLKVSKYVQAAQNIKIKKLGVNLEADFNPEKESPKVKAVLDGLRKKKVEWTNGLGKSEIIEKLGGPSAQLEAGKVSTCVAALVSAGKSASEEAKALIKKVGTKYFPASN